MASVFVIAGPNKGEIFPFDESAHAEGAVLGRDPGCEVHLTDDRISRHHARICRDAAAGACVVVDMGSVNGTTVNGVKVAGPTPLKEGDEIGLGLTRLRFSDRKLAHDAKDYAGMQHIPRQGERYRDTLT